MVLLDGLHPYEVLLAGAGSLLFIVLLPLFARQVLKDKPYNSLLAFFALPVVMIGWPSIQKVKLSQDTIELEKMTTALKENPKDSALRERVEAQVKQIKERPVSDPISVTTIAQAQLELGDQAASEATVDKGLQSAPQAPGLQELKNKIQIYKQLKNLTSTVEKDPSNTAAKAQLQDATHRATSITTASPQLVNDLAAAEFAVGHTDEATALNTKALAIAPTSKNAIQLQERISAERFSSKTVSRTKQ